SLELARKSGNKRFQADNLIYIGIIHSEKNELALAEKSLLESRDLEVSSGYSELLIFTYEQLYKLYTKSKNFEKAAFYQDKYINLKDSIYSSELISNLARVQTNFQERENLKTIREKNEILALNQEVIAQQRILNWLLAAVAVMALTLGTVIYRNYKRIKAVNAELSEAKQTIEIQNELLDAQNKILDEQVRAKTKELVQTNDALRKVNDELDNFIYKTSHDIRGPLTTLRGMTNLALMDVSDEKALGYLTKLDLTADRLNKILTRLQIVNRINHAELKLELIHFEPIIQEILTLEMKKGVPKKVKMEYEVGADVRLMSDKEMVRIVLENLIDNAFKFYNESQRVESFVKIFVKVEDGHVVTRVLDNGIGIGPMDKEKIFNMFVCASERSQTGGIGLYLSKLATEKLGGDITLTSTTEKYTEFIVRFPVDLQAVIDKRKADQQEGSQKGAASKENPVIHNA
ncbi:MAG: HAMP domain-containing histidine kinase, partial [Cyclobacteriaceae bacterium]|nr:HAMP domain-containing histidine kinase [Cyclobacteriaceae bacterium]